MSEEQSSHRNLHTSLRSLLSSRVSAAMLETRRSSRAQSSPARVGRGGLAGKSELMSLVLSFFLQGCWPDGNGSCDLPQDLRFSPLEILWLSGEILRVWFAAILSVLSWRRVFSFSETPFSSFASLPLNLCGFGEELGSSWRSLNVKCKVNSYWNKQSFTKKLKQKTGFSLEILPNFYSSYATYATLHPKPSWRKWRKWNVFQHNCSISRLQKLCNSIKIEQ